MQNCIDKFLIQGILYMDSLKMEIKMSFFSLVHLLNTVVSSDTHQSIFLKQILRSKGKQHTRLLRSVKM